MPAGIARRLFPRSVGLSLAGALFWALLVAGIGAGRPAAAQGGVLIAAADEWPTTSDDNAQYIVTSLRVAGPSPISLLTGTWPNTHIVSTQFGYNWWAIYDERASASTEPLALTLNPKSVAGAPPLPAR